VAILLSFTACDDAGTTTPPLGNTPAQVLRSLIYAFNSRDIDTLDTALADDFTFYFDPNDVGNIIGDYEIPFSWGREDMLTACGNMYDLAYHIDFDVEYETVTEPDDGATEYVASNVYIDILVMVDSQNGYVASGPCDFGFENSGYAGYDDWVITDWWDRTSSYGTLVSPSPSSLGRILAAFK
jgi:hypothetical protein